MKNYLFLFLCVFFLTGCGRCDFGCKCGTKIGACCCSGKCMIECVCQDCDCKK